jgi:ABC-type uncharacterized transport system ATPase subunit
MADHVEPEGGQRRHRDDARDPPWQARAAGSGVLIVSDDLDELVGCDRVLVIFRGQLVAEFRAGWRDHELVAAIEGVEGGD